MKKLLLLLCMVVGVIMNGAEVNATSTTEDCITVKITREYKYDEAYKLAQLINDHRIANGMTAIPVDAGLMEQAMARAVEQALLEAHTRPDGSDSGGENAYVNGGAFKAENAFNAWKNSPGHNAYMLSSNSLGLLKMGVGVVDNSAILFLRAGTGRTEVLTNKVVTTDVKVAKKYIQSVAGVDCSEDPLLTEANVGTTYDVGADSFVLRLLGSLGQKTWNPYVDWTNFDIYSTNANVLSISGRTATVKGSGTCKIVYQLRGTDFKSEYSVTISCPEDEKVEAPEKVKISSVSKKRSGKKTAITVKFIKQDDCKYQVQFSTDKNFKKSVKSFTIKSNKKTYTKSFKGKKVYVRVRAFKTVEGEKLYGDWSAKKSVKSYK